MNTFPPCHVTPLRWFPPDLSSSLLYSDTRLKAEPSHHSILKVTSTRDPLHAGSQSRGRTTSFASQRLKRVLVIQSSGFKRASEPLDLQAFRLHFSFSQRTALAKKRALGSRCAFSSFQMSLNCRADDRHTIPSQAPERSATSRRTQLALNNYLSKKMLAQRTQKENKKTSRIPFIYFFNSSVIVGQIIKGCVEFVFQTRREREKNKHLPGADYANLISLPKLPADKISASFLKS